jgi:GDP-4-dehydro-6-deoxy-D-mannose reductase
MDGPSLRSDEEGAPDGGRRERLLVTGAGGFVGGWALDALRRRAPEALLVAGVSPSRADAARPTPPGVDRLTLDLRDRAAIDGALRDLRPTGVLHLAAVSDIAAARADPDACWAVNLGGAMTLGRAAQAHAPACRFVFAGTSEAYGGTFRDAAGPLDETATLSPTNPYATSKAAADLLMAQFAAEGLATVRFRPFNHTGPGQDERFVAPAFAAQVARIEAGLAPPVLRVGDLEAERDFLDVRDVVDAYLIALLGLRPLAPGVIINLASGAPRRIRSVLDGFLARSTRPITVEADPARMRPSDTPRTAGDARRARALLGWAPRTPWDATLDDLLAWQRTRVSRGEAP